MTMDVWALASGSSGNAYLVGSGETRVLVEAGLPIGRIADYLAHRGVAPEDLAGILVTHEHSDHCRSARQLSDRYGVPLFATRGTLGHRTLRASAHARVVEPERPFRLGDLEIQPFLVPHDAAEPVGFRILGDAGAVCITTDLGFVPDGVIPRFRDNDLLVLEANHDEQMLHAGPYPQFLKQRVLGRHGHLSNGATGEALVACGDRVPSQVWLAHLSLTNNTPTHAKRVVANHLRAAGLGHVAVDVAQRNRPSLHWSSGPRTVQLPLF